MRIALCLLLAAALVPIPEAGARRVPFQPVPTAGLTVPLPGVAIIRDSARWATLWDRFPELAYGDSGRVRPARPAVDFAREMVAVVMLGSTSGCSNAASYVREINEYRDSVVVRLGPVPGQGDGLQLTCMMIVRPVEAVRMPRSAKPVRFRAPSGWTLQRAPWWDRPSLAALDRMPDEERGFFMAALALDPRTPAPMAVEIARRTPAQGWTLAGLLLEREDVRDSPIAVGALLDQADEAGRTARQIFMDRHAMRIARDPGAPIELLRLVAGRIDERSDPDLAAALLRNSRVRADREALTRFASRSGRYPDLNREACRVYAAAGWPATEPVLDGQGQPTGAWSSSLGCVYPPPSPGP